MTEQPKRQSAQTVDRALGILDQFTFENPSHSLTELSHSTGLMVSTTHRLLKALERRSFVVMDAVTRRYSVGPAVLRLAGVILDRADVYQVALPYLRELRDVSSETVGLHWLVNGHRTVIAEFESPHPLRLTSGVGRTYPLRGAAGKAILAFVRPDEIERARKDPETSGWSVDERSESAIQQDLEEIRNKGYATSFGETVPGASAIAAPIRGADGHSIASVNVTGPASRWDRESMVAFAPRLLEAVVTVERQLRYRSANAAAPALVEPEQPR